MMDPRWENIKKKSKEELPYYKIKFIQFLATDEPTFRNYSEITQGAVGDCWLLGPLSAISKSDATRHILQNNFRITGPNVYDITLYDKTTNAAVTIQINNELACITNAVYEKDIVYAGQSQNILAGKRLTVQTKQIEGISNEKLWPSWFEKAAAIIYGDYDAGLDGGDPGTPAEKHASEGFRILTGRDVRTIIIGGTENMEELLQEHAGGAVTVTTKGNAVLLDSPKRLKYIPNEREEAGEEEEEGNESENGKVNNANGKVNNANGKENNANGNENKANGNENNAAHRQKEVAYNLLEDHVYVLDSYDPDTRMITVYNPHGHVRVVNIAEQIPLDDFIHYFSRMDILEMPVAVPPANTSPGPNNLAATLATVTIGGRRKTRRCRRYSKKRRMTRKGYRRV
jgi:hypothetical protein